MEGNFFYKESSHGKMRGVLWRIKYSFKFKTLISNYLDSWQMVSFWLESIFVSNVVQDKFLTVWGNPSDCSTDDEGFIFCSNILEFSCFLSGCSIAGFVGEVVVSETGVVVLDWKREMGNF